MGVKNYILHVYIALSQLLNAILAGYPDETFSSRSYRKRLLKKQWLISYKVINKIFFWQKNHCYESWQSEDELRHLPPTLRK